MPTVQNTPASQDTPFQKAPTENELKDLLRAMTLEAFESIPGESWKIEEKSFTAVDHSCGFINLEELTYRLRAIPASWITATISPLKDFLNHYEDFFECKWPASYALFAPVTYANIQPNSLNLPHSYTCIMFFWYPPNKNTQSWVLKKVELF